MLKPFGVLVIAAVATQAVVTAVSMVLCGWDAYMPRTGVVEDSDPTPPSGIVRPVLP